MEHIKQFDILRYKEDEHGDLYFNMNDLIKVLEAKKPRMNAVVAEHVTADNMIGLLKKYEIAIKKLP